MLVLSRKPDEEIRIGDAIIVKVLRVRGDVVRIGIHAPKDIAVHREEVYQLRQKDKGDADASV